MNIVTLAAVQGKPDTGAASTFATNFNKPLSIFVHDQIYDAYMPSWIGDYPVGELEYLVLGCDSNDGSSFLLSAMVTAEVIG